ncbi:hypothetical protein [Sphingobium sp. BS19]|uniref:hypothetical protein n=1 Tax=Sphingobium sp. BS19 TaxID=3018973 RepID=UPI0022EF08E9|nr:hypothetical protein [Sphingobium sp. BS19]GLI99122.1 hypothetical protein Sbs19_29400 [Sphingobium sp. BS19]
MAYRARFRDPGYELIDNDSIGGTMIYYVAAFLALAAQDVVPTDPVPAPAPTVAPAAQGGKIVMYRGGGVMGLALACPIRFKGQEIIELGRGKYGEWAVPAGSYILSNKTASVEINVAPGQTKYVRCQIKPGFMTGRADLQIVDQESFAEHQADYERKEVMAPAL